MKVTKTQFDGPGWYLESLKVNKITDSYNGIFYRLLEHNSKYLTIHYHFI